MSKILVGGRGEGGVRYGNYKALRTKDDLSGFEENARTILVVKPKFWHDIRITVQVHWVKNGQQTKNALALKSIPA